MTTSEKIVTAGYTAVAAAVIVYFVSSTVAEVRVNRARRKLVNDMRETNRAHHRIATEINDQIDREKFKQIIRDNDL